jgi:hypothetical protein
MLFTVFLLCGFLKKTRLYSGFKNGYKNIRETRKLESVLNSILKKGKMIVENQTKT